MAAHNHCLILDLESKSGKELVLEDLGLFLYDVATLYDLVRLALDAAYGDYRFGKYPLFRGRRPLKPQDQLVLEHVQSKGHLRVTACLTSENSNSDQALELAELELATLFGLPPPRISARRSRGTVERAQARLGARGAEQHLETVRRRLKRSPLTVSGIKIVPGT